MNGTRDDKLKSNAACLPVGYTCVHLVKVEVLDLQKYVDDESSCKQGLYLQMVQKRWDLRPRHSISIVHTVEANKKMIPITTWLMTRTQSTTALLIHGATKVQLARERSLIHANKMYTHWMFLGRGPCYRPPFRSVLAIAHVGDVYTIAYHKHTRLDNDTQKGQASCMTIKWMEVWHILVGGSMKNLVTPLYIEAPRENPLLFLLSEATNSWRVMFFISSNSFSYSAT
jgi:hypothetical protein